jgi:HD-GYP domain-containing protein (c-di-GMP phosphodiesterase class II)
LHDIGKIGISDSILLKPDKLTAEEWEEIRKHPIVGHQIVQGIKFLERPASLIKWHHERFDGKGYPNGLKGRDIPLEARLFAIVDTYDALTSDRPYRKAFSSEAAETEIKRCSGTQFDPDLVQVFLQIPQEELDEIASRFS